MLIDYWRAKWTKTLCFTLRRLICSLAGWF